MTDFEVVIGHRDRGKDWRRQANLDSAVQWWRDCGIEPLIVDDGRSGDAHWNRSAAYNRGMAITSADVVVFSEADMLIPVGQILKGVELAAESPGLVIGFSQFLAMEESDTELVRQRAITPAQAASQQVRGDCQSIGAVNITSRASVAMVGRFDEGFEGHAYDDDATELAFRICCGPTRFVTGPGWHQYHVPGAFYATPESTAEDREATERNRLRFELYRQARTPDEIRALTLGE